LGPGKAREVSSYERSITITGKAGEQSRKSDSDMSRATFLEKQLEELRSQIGKNQLLIEALAQKIAAWQSENQVIENSLEESQKTAGEAENQARARAEEILADAEAVVASQKAQLAAILMEIESLKEELRACEMPRSEAAAPTKRSGEPSGPGSNTRREEETRAGEMGPRLLSFISG